MRAVILISTLMIATAINPNMELEEKESDFLARLWAIALICSIAVDVGEFVFKHW